MMNTNTIDSILVLIAVNKYGEEIRKGCALSITHQQIYFSYKGRPHTIKYKQTKKGNYFILNNTRYYFKVYDNIENKWVFDCNCF